MAEGGYDNEVDTRDEGEDEDEREDEESPLIERPDRRRKRGGARPKERRKEGSLWQRPIEGQDPPFRDRIPEYFDKTEYNGTEYYFGGTRGEEAKQEFAKVYPKMDRNSTKVKFGISSNGTTVVSLNRAGQNKPYNIDYETGTISKGDNKGKNLEFPDGIKKVLGKRSEEINLENFTQIVEEEEEEMANTSFIEAVKDEIEQTDDIGRKRELQREISQREIRNQEIISNRERLTRENEAIEERLPLREKVKLIFKKYGFTVVAVLTAIGAVIGSILSNLKTGLAKVAKGVGNGLKDLGAKLAGILPGMIGAIAKFLFDTAGEVVGFLAEHAWVLIVGLVVLVVESLKKKVGRKK